MISEKEFEEAKQTIKNYYIQVAESAIEKPFSKSDVFGVDIECSTQFKNTLNRVGIHNVYDVEEINNLPRGNCCEFLKYRNFGRKKLDYLTLIMKPYGIIIKQ